VFTTAGPYPDLINPVHILFSLDPPSTPRSSKQSLPSQNFVHLFKKIRNPHTNYTPKDTKIIVTVVTFILGQDNFSVGR
jgi:hypothetical protein